MSQLLTDLALVAFMVVILLTVPPHLQHQLAPEVPAAQAKERADPAPVWSKRCEEQRKSHIAHQADGGPWRTACHGEAKKP